MFGWSKKTRMPVSKSFFSAQLESLEARRVLSAESLTFSFEDIPSDPDLSSELAKTILAGYDAARETEIAAGLPESEFFLTTADSPANHVTPTGTALDGVGDVLLTFPTGTFRCSTTLLPNGTHTLTAEHCLFDSMGNFPTAATVFFDLASGTEAIAVTGFTIHTGFTGNPTDGNDIAILNLAAPASDSVPRTDIYRASDEVGQTISYSGYGRTGTGNQGDILVSGTKRDGDNRIDALGEALNGTVYPSGTVPSGIMVVTDFDNGLVANDASGFWLGISNLGLGNDEVSTANGDSGGPSLLDGKIAAVTSFGRGFNGFTDVLAGTNSSFGEFAVNTRVSAFDAWIDGVVDIVSPTVIDVIIGGSPSHADYDFDAEGADGSGEQIRTVPVGGIGPVNFFVSRWLGTLFAS